MAPALFWFILGVILIIVEIATPSFFVMWFAIGSFAASLIGLFAEDNLILQFTVFVVTSLILVVLTRKIANRISGKPSRNINQDEIIGKEAYVVKDILSDGSEGIVRISGEEWRALSANSTFIPEGSRVKVVSLKGVKLTVEALNPINKEE